MVAPPAPTRSRTRARKYLGAILRRVADDDRARCLVYHEVVADEERDAAQMTISASLLAAQLDAMRERGYQVVDATWCVARLQAGYALPRRSVVVTFDDGLAGVARAAPVLRERGISATVFVSPSIATGSVAGSRRVLDPRQLRELVATGAFTVGAHGATHVALSALDDASLARETAGARRDLEDLLGVSCDLFAYPFGSFGSWDRRARAAVERAGYVGAFTSVFGTLAGDVYALPRCRVSWTEDIGGLDVLLHGGYDWYRWVQRAQGLR